ncbi:MAG: GntR family transcriptional regulator [Kiloniellaceae bacterium]
MAAVSDTKSKKRTQGTAHGRVYAGLKSALMNGDFLPGQRLVVRSLAERFETSAMPVREALRQLVSEAALVDHPNRGVIVPDATVEVIADLVRVRCSIEGAATEWAASTISPDELETILRLNEGMEKCTSQSDAEDYLALNREFHFAVYKASRSLVLQPIIERLWLRAGPWLNIMREEATLGLGLDHHSEIVEGLRKGDGARARRALVADITDAADIMLRAASSPDFGHAMSRRSVKRAAPAGRARIARRARSPR